MTDDPTQPDPDSGSHASPGAHGSQGAHGGHGAHGAHAGHGHPAHGGHVADSEPDQPGGRRRLLAAWRPRATRAQLLAGLLCAVLGFALVVQVQQNQTGNLSTLRQSDLLVILDTVTKRSRSLEDQAQRLEQQRAQLQSGVDRAGAAQQAALQQLAAYEILTGTQPAEGPGIQLDIADPQVTVSAVTLLDAVEELRNAGAEAMQIGDVRIVASTSFADDPQRRGVLVDQQLVRPPYRVLVIGDPATLAPALEIPGGVLDALKQVNATGTQQRLATVEVRAVHTLAPLAYARPAPAPPP